VLRVIRFSRRSEETVKKEEDGKAKASKNANKFISDLRKKI
jgi:hypothetical protein